MWKSADAEQRDSGKYQEKMEEREFSSEKGAVSGSLLDRTTGLSAPSNAMTVSASFLDALSSDGHDRAVAQLVESTAPKPAPPKQAVAAANPYAYTVDKVDAAAQTKWEEEQVRRACTTAVQSLFLLCLVCDSRGVSQAARKAAEDAATAKRKAKRDKKKAKKKSKGTGGAAVAEDEAEADDDDEAEG
jgi:Na+-transporting methylmalonyl-CoA/oxaloacetate decarboxylase gamma subunit